MCSMSTSGRGFRIAWWRWRRLMPGVVGRAVLGSLALGEGDRWSDLRPHVCGRRRRAVREVLEASSTSDRTRRWGPVRLFDLPERGADASVALPIFPTAWSSKLSFTPASEFGAGGPSSGCSSGRPSDPVPSEPRQRLFGYAVHHAAHARTCINCGEYWHAGSGAPCATTHWPLRVAGETSIPVRQGLDRLPRSPRTPPGRCIRRYWSRPNSVQASASTPSPTSAPRPSDARRWPIRVRTAPETRQDPLDRP